MAEIVEAYVRSSVEVFTDPDTPSGCFMVCASAALSSASDDVAQMLRRKHHAQEAALKACFDRKVQQGELLAKTDTALLAKYVICTIEGMSVQAREGASRSDLLRLLEALMLVWRGSARLAIRCNNRPGFYRNADQLAFFCRRS